MGLGWVRTAVWNLKKRWITSCFRAESTKKTGFRNCNPHTWPLVLGSSSQFRVPICNVCRRVRPFYVVKAFCCPSDSSPIWNRRAQPLSSLIIESSYVFYCYSSRNCSRAIKNWPEVGYLFLLTPLPSLHCFSRQLSSWFYLSSVFAPVHVYLSFTDLRFFWPNCYFFNVVECLYLQKSHKFHGLIVRISRKCPPKPAQQHPATNSPSIQIV